MRESREVSIVREKAMADRVEKFLPGIVVISALTGFSVLAWYAYRTNVATTQESDLIVVEAEKTPMKEKPLDPGGMKFPNQDKTIFETFSGGSQAAKVERVLPAPEEPMQREADTTGTETWVNERLHKNVGKLEAVDKAVADEASRREQVIGDDAKPAEKVAALKPDTLASDYEEEPARIQTDTVEAYVAKPSVQPAPVKTVAPVVVEKPVAVEKKVESSVVKADSWEDVAKTIKDDEAPAAPVNLKEKKEAKAEEKKPTPSAKGAFKVQLGAYPSEQEARKDYARISKKFSSAGSYPLAVVKAQLPKGTFYRLRLTGFGSAADAKAFCSKLSAGGQACILPKD